MQNSHIRFLLKRYKGEKMYIALGYIYIIFIIGTMFLILKDSKNSKGNRAVNKEITTNKKYKKIARIIVPCTMLIYYIIGRIFKNDIFNAITVTDNGCSISFIGIILVFITSIAILFIYDFIRKRREEKENQ